MSRFLRRWVLLPLLLLVAVPLVAWMGLPWPWVLGWVDPPATSFMLYRERQAERADEKFAVIQDWVPLEAMPETLVRAVLVSEDDRFRQHHGVDWKSLAEEVHWAGDTTFSWTRAEGAEEERELFVAKPAAAHEAFLPAAFDQHAIRVQDGEFLVRGNGVVLQWFHRFSSIARGIRGGEQDTGAVRRIVTQLLRASCIFELGAWRAVFAMS